VIIPAALPGILVGARLAAGAGWMSMVAAELIGAPSGLGFAVEWYRELLMTPKVLAFVVLIGLMGYLFDRALRYLQRSLTRWAEPRNAS
jgi:ABC-type nitrate/sulfonate/bicarbonate transport system permease component